MITVKEAKEKMDGVVIPLATIFKNDLTVDIEATQQNAQWIVDQGAKPGNTVFIAVGSGGDFTVMTTEERKSAIKAIAEVAVPNNIPTFASVQSTDIRTTIELSQLCEEVGIDIVQMSSAFYYDVKKGDIIEWVNEVSKHTQVGFAAYSHWYSGSKYDMTMDVAEELLKVPNTVAVKWGSPNIANYLAGINYFVPRAAVVNNGPLGIYGHQLGVKAWVSHVPNFLPQHFIIFTVIVAWHEGVILMLYSVDKSHISMAISLVYILVTIHCAKRIYAISLETNLSRKIEKIIRNEDKIKIHINDERVLINSKIRYARSLV